MVFGDLVLKKGFGAGSVFWDKIIDFKGFWIVKWFLGAWF